ncbi:hypothetical protein NCCP2716_27500 [Sporosarcina sp. NCCP-2716]|uniref:hypothetical protein n=1 Tax=Sporosarcina sp. NCCP-2716 TaxID=2943679 RepID=UPI00203EF9E4|nr:hypothetical protein [Sporosarcina sp. NCCP-2716]GKV70252.1 hypothetical protein NCCP2716_27500 [Sporosarcina sp. NCCP-2716]
MTSKPTDWDRLETLESAVYQAGDSLTITISRANFNWLLLQAGRWLSRDERRIKNSYSWTPEERQIMKENGLIPNNCVSRMQLGWSREDAVNTPKLSAKERGSRLKDGAQ